MEELNKTQLILLALLVSFVTSIATGIVTVTLMDQAPPGVTQTINRVVKKTERVVVPSKTQGANVAEVVSEEDLIVDAVDTASPSIVRIGIPAQSAAGTSTPQTHFIGSAALFGDNMIAVPAGYVPESETLVMKLSDGTELTAERVKSGERVSVFAPSASSTVPELTTLNSADMSQVRAGQMALAVMRDASGIRLARGIVSRIGGAEEVALNVTLEAPAAFVSAPVVTSDGSLLGILLSAESNSPSLLSAAELNAFLKREETTEETSGGSDQDISSEEGGSQS